MIEYHPDCKKCQAAVACDADENIFAPCASVSCVCRDCPGTLRSIGRNTMDTLTFLECDVCRCGYVAEDKKEREKKDA